MIAVMPQATEQLPDRADRDTIAGRLAAPERGVRHGIADPELAHAPPANENAEDGSRRRFAGQVLLVVCDTGENPAEMREIIVVAAGVMFPAVNEDQNDGVFFSRSKGVDAIRNAVYLATIVAASQIVELDDRQLIRVGPHEAMKRLMRRVRHNTDGPIVLGRREIDQAVVRNAFLHDSLQEQRLLLVLERQIWVRTPNMGTIK
ncbi:hypothetical protein [Beijerinckia sp. L45]|uniref:hypothetical protein n=1 Tax=Beijerinckia sp. L45 TaxID=1641855 RepID=UPI00131D7BA3|nr:hypothetical protein [Beijerinckia sp. L45]